MREGRLEGLMKGDVMMRGVSPVVHVAFKTLGQFNILIYPPLPFNCLFQRKIPRRKQSTIEFWLQGWWLAGIAHFGTSKKGSGFEPSGVQVKHLPVLCQWASLGGAKCLSRRVCRWPSKEKIKIELLEAHWKREREREREGGRKLHFWHLQGAFPSSNFLIIADYLSLHHPAQVCFFFSAAAAVVLSSVSPHVWRLLSHLLLNFWDWRYVAFEIPKQFLE